MTVETIIKPERAELVYDVEAVRADFPILSREVYGKPLTYLDNGASAQKPQVMLDAVQKAKDEGATDEQLKPALELQRKAQWRLDFIAAENSMGFHAPQEAARVLGEAAE